MLEQYGVITSLKPSCGWTFPQEYEGGTHVVEAGSGKELVEALLQFRIKAKLPIGDPEREVAMRIKELSPNNSRFKGYKHKTKAELKPVSTHVPLIERLRVTIAALIEQKPRFVTEDEADARSEICRNCPQNVAWRIPSCAPCNAEVEYQGIVLRQRHAYRHDGELKGCRLHNLYLPSAVFLDADALPERHEQAPPPCWIPKP